MINVTNATLSLHYAASCQHKQVDVIASRLIEHEGHHVVANVYRSWAAGIMLAEIIIPEQEYALLTHAAATDVLEVIHRLDYEPSDSDIDTLQSLLSVSADATHPMEVWDMVPVAPSTTHLPVYAKEV